ncbi:hypothetical protein [Neolewinella persica]|uniref:hypothetical protein n=1 Tax=Neolewinella persica TaxID=70998 RepID=UPI0003812B0F|nr:hypothetical protein [Neolewinella persica]
MKKKQQSKEAQGLNVRTYFAVVATIILLFYLGRQGYQVQQPENDTTTLGMTPGAVRAFSEGATVLPVGRGEVPVGVLRLNGETFVVYGVGE